MLVSATSAPGGAWSATNVSVLSAGGRRSLKHPRKEHDEECALFEWARMNEGFYPELRLLHAIPNGGWRHKATAARLKREGVKPGVPDVCLPVARHGWHGLYIEMKVGYNKPTDNQEQWLRDLELQGYMTEVCYDWQNAANIIEAYLEVSG